MPVQTDARHRPRAERLGLEAANALLKTLEEPPKETVIILTSANSDALPSTVLSRCLKVNFNALPPTVLQEEIEKQHGLESDQARLLALMTGEYLAGGQALNPPELLQFRAQVLDRLNALEGAPTAALFDLAEDLAGRPEEIDLFLAVLAAWCRDLLVLSSGGGEGLVNQDMKKDLAEKVVSAPASKWAARLNAVFEARAAIDAHANPRLALEALLIGHLPGQTEVP